jgi:hypothetical protein
VLGQQGPPLNLRLQRLELPACAAPIRSRPHPEDAGLSTASDAPEGFVVLPPGVSILEQLEELLPEAVGVDPEGGQGLDGDA